MWGHERRKLSAMRSAALSIVMASSAQGWISKTAGFARAPSALRPHARTEPARRRRGVVLEATPSKSWQRGNALSYASGDVYAKHGLEAVLSHPLLTKEEEFELGSKVQKLSQIEKTRSSLRENCTDASDDSVAKLLGYVDPIDIFRAEVAGRDAREHMILSNMRLVVSTARRAQARLPRATQLAVDRDGGAQALEDLVAEGTLGLATAVDRYDPGRGFRFSTYAVWWVRQAIQKASRKRQIVAVPRHVQELGKQCENATKQLRDMLGRSPCVLRRPVTFLRYDAIDATRLHQTRPWVVSFSILSAFRARSRLIHITRRSVDELAAFLDLKPKQVERATRSGLATLSLDVPLGRSKTAKGSGAGDGGDAASLADLLEAPEVQPYSSAAFHELRDAIDVAMKRSLDNSERDVLRLRLGLDDGNSRTRPQVGQIMGLDTRKVRGIEQGALTKLRKGPASLEMYLPRDGGVGGPPPEF